MKKIELYKAFDGKLFDSMTDCADYELEKYEENERIFLEHFKLDFETAVDGGCNIPLMVDDEAQFFAVKIENEEDIRIFNNHMNNTHNDAACITKGSIGKTLIVSRKDEYYYNEGLLDNLKAEYEKLIEKFTEMAENRFNKEE